MLTIEGLKQFVAWIGGAVAGLSILFYAAGYLVHRAHINMLGLAGVVDSPHEQLLYEGAKFYFTVGAYLLQSFFVIGIAVLIVVIALMLLREIGWLDRMGRAVTASLRARLDRLKQRNPTLLGACALALLAGLFVVHTDRFFYPLEDVYTRIEHLLYQSPSAGSPANCGVMGPTGASAADGALVSIVHWLQQGERCRSQLLAEFRRLLAGYLVLLFALAYFTLPEPRQAPSTMRRIAIGTLTAYGLLYTLFLPMAFGVLVRSPIYPIIALRGNTETEAVDTFSPLLLLNKNDRGLLVWNRATRAAMWMQTDVPVRIDVLGQANAFERLPPRGAKR